MSTSPEEKVVGYRLKADDRVTDQYGNSCQVVKRGRGLALKRLDGSGFSILDQVLSYTKVN